MSKLQAHSLIRDGASHQETRSCQTENKYLIMGLRWKPDTKTDGQLPVSHKLTLSSTSGWYLGFRPEKDCFGEGQKQLKITDPTSRHRGRPTSTTCNCLKIIKERKKKIGRWSQMGA
jgi:hypothetical protein